MIMGLILLMVLTMLALTTLNLGKSSLQIVGNMQWRKQVIAVAQEAIDDAISTTRLFLSPAAIYLNPCSGTNTKCVDVNGDGNADVTVELKPTPTCVKAQVFKSASVNLNLNDPNDQACVLSPTVGPDGLIVFKSMCSDTVWQVRAQATDNATQTAIAVTEGVAVRVSTDVVATYCP